MDVDAFLPKNPEDPLAILAREDLDRYSVDELAARITVLEGEIARVRRKIDASINHRATAEGLFRR